MASSSTTTPTNMVVLVFIIFIILIVLVSIILMSNKKCRKSFGGLFGMKDMGIKSSVSGFAKSAASATATAAGQASRGMARGVTGLASSASEKMNRDLISSALASDNSLMEKTSKELSISDKGLLSAFVASLTDPNSIEKLSHLESFKSTIQGRISSMESNIDLDQQMIDQLKGSIKVTNLQIQKATADKRNTDLANHTLELAISTDRLKTADFKQVTESTVIPRLKDTLASIEIELPILTELIEFEEHNKTELDTTVSNYSNSKF